VKILAIALLCLLPLAAQPKRIVSTSPSITETLFALGLGDRVVGVSEHCHYPPEALKLPKVGSYTRPNVETIIGLRPDLVILQNVPESPAALMQRMGLNVLMLEQGDLQRTYASIRAIGGRAGVPDRAEKLVAEISARLEAVRKRNAQTQRRSLVFIVGRVPGKLDGLIAVGKGSYLNELIEIAGGVNALARSPLPYPQLSLEAMLGVNPDVIVDMGDMAQTVGITDAHKRSVVALWEQQKTLKAAQQKRVFAIASDIFVVPGPRIAEAAEAFAKMLHPETAH
jgi:iron complex transport system substrate-binding protein